MRKVFFGIIVFIVTLNAMQMNNYRAVSMDQATILQDGKEKKYCKVCGMTLPMFYKTNHAVKVDGKWRQYCSIVCMVEDIVVSNLNPTTIKVVDNSTLKMIDVKDAFYVVGSKKPGTMSMLSKYAFGTKDAAIHFKEKFGGKLMRYDELFKLVHKNHAKDMAATKKRQAKAIKKGAMMYKKICKPTSIHFNSTAQAKLFLTSSQICGNIKGKKLQAIGMYLVNRK